MARDARDVDEKSRLDEVLLSYLPGNGDVVAVQALGLSEWCNTYRIEVRVPGGRVERFFAKEVEGERGLDLMRCNWTYETSMYRFLPDNVPRPIAMGTYKTRPGVHFFLMEYVDMMDGEIPPAETLMPVVAKLHRGSMDRAPDGRFGSGVNSWFGSLVEANVWEGSWELWFTNHMARTFACEEEIRGRLTVEERGLVETYIRKVVPRYLHPLETDGRRITPGLAHADLWPGNFKLGADGERVVVYDSNVLWAHNEFELGTISNPRYPLGTPYLEEYWKHMPRSEPREDAEGRVAVYHLFGLFASFYFS